MTSLGVKRRPGLGGGLGGGLHTRGLSVFSNATRVVTARETADAVITALSPAAWYRNATDVVSSGGFASIWADYASSDVGLVLPGVVGNQATTPDSAALDLTGDVVMLVRVSLVDWTPVALGNFCGKLGAAANAGYRFSISSGTLSFMYGAAGALTTRSATALTGITDGDYSWVKVVFDADDGASQNVTKFYIAADSDSVPSSWTQVGATVTAAGAVTIATHNGTFGFGFDGSGGGGQPINGVMRRCIVYSDIAETTKVLDADFSSQAIGTASFTESSSNAATVTINTSGAAPAHIGKARDLLQGTGTNQPAYSAGVFTFDGADNYMVASTWSQTQPTSIVAVVNLVTWTNGDTAFDGTSGALVGSVWQSGVTPAIVIRAGTSAASNTNLAINTRGILCGVINGASSSLRVNDTAKTTGDAGASNMGGFTLGCRFGPSSYVHGAFEEVIIFSAALSDAEQDDVITALNNALTVF